MSIIMSIIMDMKYMLMHNIVMIIMYTIIIVLLCIIEYTLGPPGAHRSGEPDGGQPQGAHLRHTARYTVV